MSSPTVTATTTSAPAAPTVEAPVVGSSTPPPPGPDPVPTDAFSVGWLIAQLHGPVLTAPVRADPGTPLPAVDKLGRADRVHLALERLQAHLQGALATALTPVSGQVAPTVDALARAWDPSQPEETKSLQQAVEAFHIDLLTRLEVKDRRYASAYSLGRSLSDTCWLPTDKASLEKRFAKSRLSVLQAWLADLDASLPKLSTGAVAEGLDHWASWLQVHAHLTAEQYRTLVVPALQAQGEHWRSLLAGEKNPTSLLSPEAYVEAGEAALHRAGVIARRAVVHFWWVLFVVLLATSGTIFVALRYTQGATKLWGTAISLLASVGISGASLRATAKQLATEAGHTLFNLEEADAVGWAVTWLPPIAPTRTQGHKLRMAGVATPRSN